MRKKNQMVQHSSKIYYLGKQIVEMQYAHLDGWTFKLFYLISL